MKISKFILLFLAAVLFSTSARASEFGKPEEKWFFNRIFYGASLGFQLGSVVRYEAAPVIGYYFSPAWSAGIGIRYIYFRDKRMDFNFTSHIYGGNIFTDFVVIPDLDRVLPFRMVGALFLRGEFEVLSMPSQDFDIDRIAEGNRFWKPGYILGAGIKQAAGKRTQLFILSGYNFNDSGRLPYDNPFIRFGIVF